MARGEALRQIGCFGVSFLLGVGVLGMLYSQNKDFRQAIQDRVPALAGNVTLSPTREISFPVATATIAPKFTGEKRITIFNSADFPVNSVTGLPDSNIFVGRVEGTAWNPLTDTVRASDTITRAVQVLDKEFFPSAENPTNWTANVARDQGITNSSGISVTTNITRSVDMMKQQASQKENGSFFAVEANRHLEYLANLAVETAKKSSPDGRVTPEKANQVLEQLYRLGRVTLLNADGTPNDQIEYTKITAISTDGKIIAEGLDSNFQLPVGTKFVDQNLTSTAQDNSPSVMIVKYVKGGKDKDKTLVPDNIVIGDVSYPIAQVVQRGMNNATLMSFYRFSVDEKNVDFQFMTVTDMTDENGNYCWNPTLNRGNDGKRIGVLPVRTAVPTKAPTPTPTPTPTRGGEKQATPTNPPPGATDTPQPTATRRATATPQKPESTLPPTSTRQVNPSVTPPPTDVIRTSTPIPRPPTSTPVPNNPPATPGRQATPTPDNWRPPTATVAPSGADSISETNMYVRSLLNGFTGVTH
jgi:hypothetical protein